MRLSGQWSRLLLVVVLLSTAVAVFLVGRATAGSSGERIDYVEEVVPPKLPVQGPLRTPSPPALDPAEVFPGQG